MKAALLAACVLVSVSSVHAQSATDPSGHWEGSVQAPEMAVPIEIDLTKNSKGQIAGTFGQPAKKLKGLPLFNVAVEGTSITFQIKGSAQGQRVFKGVLSADGKTISGEYSQEGQSMPFRLTRTGDPAVPAPTRNARISKELEGAWNATLNGKETRHLTLTLSNQPDGTAIGSILNVDEGVEIPIATIAQKGSSVTLELAAIGASYSGVLNTEATELTGTFTHGTVALPLTFRRAVPSAGKK
jgi:hypothetical protein